MAAELPEQQFDTWIRPLTQASLPTRDAAADAVVVQVPNRFKLDWIRTQYATRIEAVLSELAGRPMRLELVLAPRVEGDGAASVAALLQPTFGEESRQAHERLAPPHGPHSAAAAIPAAAALGWLALAEPGPESTGMPAPGPRG